MALIKELTDKADSFKSEIRISGRVADVNGEVTLAVWIADEYDGFEYKQARTRIKLSGLDAIKKLRNLCDELIKQSKTAIDSKETAKVVLEAKVPIEAVDLPKE